MPGNTCEGTEEYGGINRLVITTMDNKTIKVPTYTRSTFGTYTYLYPDYKTPNVAFMRDIDYSVLTGINHTDFYTYNDHFNEPSKKLFGISNYELSKILNSSGNQGSNTYNTHSGNQGSDTYKIHKTFSDVEDNLGYYTTREDYPGTTKIYYNQKFYLLIKKDAYGPLKKVNIFFNHKSYESYNIQLSSVGVTQWIEAKTVGGSAPSSGTIKCPQCQANGSATCNHSWTETVVVPITNDKTGETTYNTTTNTQTGRNL